MSFRYEIYMNRKTVNTIIFGIGVLMLLIRPYLVYQLSSSVNSGKYSVKLSLLQRLIKKKDDHFQWHDKAIFEIRGCRFSFIPPVKQLSAFYLQGGFQSSIYYSILFASAFAGISCFRQANNRHSILSCFRI